MRKVILHILFFWLIGLSTEAQLNISLESKNVDELLAQGNAHYQNQNYDQALDFAYKAYSISESMGNHIDISRACLLLSEVYRETQQYNESLEFGLRCIEYSRENMEEYYFAGNLALIHLFSSWGAWEKELEYIDLMLFQEGKGISIRLLLYELKKDCLFKLGRNEEARLVLDGLITEYKVSGNKEGFYGAVLDMSILLRSNGNYSEGISYLMTLNGPDSNFFDAEQLAVVENNIGELYLRKGQLSQAIEHVNMASSKINYDNQEYSAIKINQALLNFRLEKHTEAFQFVELAIAKSAAHSEWENNATAHALKMLILSQKGELELAFQEGEKALNAAEKTKNGVLLAEIYGQLSELKSKQGDSDSAKEFMLKKQETDRKRNEYINAERQRHIEKIAFINNKEKASISSIISTKAESERLEQELISTKREKEIAKLEYEKASQEASLFSEQLAKDRAIKELALVQAALLSEQQRFTIAELEQAKTEEQLKVTELGHLQAERERGIELLRKENELLNSEQKRKDLESQKDAALKKSGIALIVFISLLLLFSLIAFFSTKKKNKEIKRNEIALNAFNVELKEKNHEITSSIVFAKNFQELIVPNEDVFREAFPNSFLIYQPMDIVSGDIPFILNKEEKLYIAAIDCTGHGVPAAMQSFMVYYNLNELILEYPDDSCAELLSKLHRKLSISTNKTKEDKSFAAGVDIGLCCIKKGTLELEFAGANQPLILLTNTGVQKIAGDKFTVGDTSNKNEVSFTNERKELSLGDRIYLLSDGFIHQFGGDDGKHKFSTKRLLNEISAQRGNAHIRAKLNLEQSLKTWKGNTDQTDDIMLIGIEISEPITLK